MTQIDEQGRIVPTAGLKRLPFDDGIAKTFLGQAHIAGTGPDGMTCRECTFWHSLRTVKTTRGGGTAPVPCQPGHSAKDGKLKKAQCRYLIRGKPKRAIPHDALACRLFKHNPDAPPIQIEVKKPRKPKGTNP